jgi:hypothetical protein
VALRQQTRPPEDLVRARLGADARIDGPLSIPGGLVNQWREVGGRSNVPGESAIVAGVDGASVLLHGSAGEAELAELASLLTDETR